MKNTKKFISAATALALTCGLVACSYNRTNVSVSETEVTASEKAPTATSQTEPHVTQTVTPSKLKSEETGKKPLLRLPVSQAQSKSAPVQTELVPVNNNQEASNEDLPVADTNSSTNGSVNNSANAGNTGHSENTADVAQVAPPAGKQEEPADTADTNNSGTQDTQDSADTANDPDRQNPTDNSDPEVDSKQHDPASTPNPADTTEQDPATPAPEQKENTPADTPNEQQTVKPEEQKKQAIQALVQEAKAADLNYLADFISKSQHSSIAALKNLLDLAKQAKKAQGTAKSPKKPNDSSNPTGTGAQPGTQKQTPAVIPEQPQPTEENLKELKALLTAHKAKLDAAVKADLTQGFNEFLQYVISDNSFSAQQKKDAERALNVLQGRADKEIVRQNMPPAKPSWYDERVKLGTEDPNKGDDMRNLKASVSYMKTLNNYRQSRKLNSLNVSLTNVATAVINSFYSDENIAHSKYYNVYENLAWNPKVQVAADYSGDPAAVKEEQLKDFYEQWISNEKKVYDAAVAAGKTKEEMNKEAAQDSQKQVGHYLNFIEPSIHSMGFTLAHNAKNAYGTTGVWNAGFAASDMTVQDYENAISRFAIAKMTEDKRASAQKEYDTYIATLAKIEKIEQKAQKVEEKQKNPSSPVVNPATDTEKSN